jgi:hypothetical protein
VGCALTWVDVVAAAEKFSGPGTLCGYFYYCRLGVKTAL